jgi:D-3-phosphoglycerate dehydrogenase / 2-oxoglutarate reductase
MKILILDQNHSIIKDSFLSNGFDVTEDYSSPKEVIENTASNYDGIIIRGRFTIDKTFLDAAINLKFIGRVGAGLENIDCEYAKEKNIQLFNAPEGNKDALGEHSLGMLLMLLHRIKIADNEVRNGIWLREENRGDELMGKTVGIIGYGNMGKAFAKRLSGFSVTTICYDILPNVGDENAKQVNLETLFSETEVLSIHTPLTNETNKIIDASFINQFKKPFYFINTARGKCVVTKDLVEAIKQEKIKGACLDVLEYEKSSFDNFFTQDIPDEFNWLIHSEKVILSPHIAGWTIQSKEKLGSVLANKIIDYYRAKK